MFKMLSWMRGLISLVFCGSCSDRGTGCSPAASWDLPPLFLSWEFPSPMLNLVFLQLSFSWFATLFYRTHTVVTSWRKIRDVLFDNLHVWEKFFFYPHTELIGEVLNFMLEIIFLQASESISLSTSSFLNLLSKSLILAPLLHPHLQRYLVPPISESLGTGEDSRFWRVNQIVAWFSSLLV